MCCGMQSWQCVAYVRRAEALASGKLVKRSTLGITVLDNCPDCRGIGGALAIWRGLIINGILTTKGVGYDMC